MHLGTTNTIGVTWDQLRFSQKAWRVEGAGIALFLHIRLASTECGETGRLRFIQIVVSLTNSDVMNRPNTGDLTIPLSLLEGLLCLFHIYLVDLRNVPLYFERIILNRLIRAEYRIRVFVVILWSFYHIHCCSWFRRTNAGALIFEQLGGIDLLVEFGTGLGLVFPIVDVFVTLIVIFLFILVGLLSLDLSKLLFLFLIFDHLLF